MWEESAGRVGRKSWQGRRSCQAGIWRTQLNWTVQGGGWRGWRFQVKMWPPPPPPSLQSVSCLFLVVSWLLWPTMAGEADSLVVGRTVYRPSEPSVLQTPPWERTANMLGRTDRQLQSSNGRKSAPVRELSGGLPVRKYNIISPLSSHTQLSLNCSILSDDWRQYQDLNTEL